MMHPSIRLTSKAATLLQTISKEYKKPALLLDDTSCYSNSDVMLRENEPSWPVSLLAEIDGVRVFVNPILERSLKAKQIIIDALDFADDSLSLKRDYGKRLIMQVETLSTRLFLSYPSRIS
jgi:uncharacterized protein (DUF779 family)